MAPGQSLKEQIAKKVLGRGSLYHAYSDVAGKGKWIAVLNDAWPPPDGIAVYAFFTSSVERFKRAKIPPAVYIQVAIGEYDFCVEPTIFDLTDVQRRPLGEILNAGMFKYCGTLRPEHLTQADKIVETSPYVSKQNRKAILGSRYTG